MAEQEDAYLAIMKQIADLAPKVSSTGTLQLAEAYAWLTTPNNAHGGSTTVNK